MTNLTDLQLITNYHETKSNIYFEILLTRYDGYIKNQSSKLYNYSKEFNSSLDYEDINQELKLKAYNALLRFKKERVTNEEFSFYVLLNDEIRNYKQETFYPNGNFIKTEITDIKQYSEDEKDSEKYLKFLENKINENYHKNGSERYYKTIRLIENFKQTLSKKEKRIFKLLVESKKKKYEIAKQLKVSNQYLSFSVKRIGRRLKDYIEENEI